MEIKAVHKIMIEGTIHIHGGMIKNHPAELGTWFGEEKCYEIDLHNQIKRVTPDGEYKITIMLEKI